MNLALFGTTEAYNAAAYTSDSLIGSFIHKQAINENGSNLSVRARQMIAVIPMPILAKKHGHGLKSCPNGSGVGDRINGERHIDTDLTLVV